MSIVSEMRSFKAPNPSSFHTVVFTAILLAAFLPRFAGGGVDEVNEGVSGEYLTYSITK